MNTRKNFELCLLAVFGGASTFNDAAVESSICLSRVTNKQRPARQLEDALIQDEGLPLLLPPHERREVNVHLAVQDCTVSFIDRWQLRLAGEPGKTCQ